MGAGVDRIERLKLIVLLAAISSLGPFAMQSVAPALPLVAEGLAVSPSAAQVLLSLSALAIGAATLGLGALSDQLGRRPVLMWSCAVAVVASAAVAASTTLEAAAVARFVQAGACGAGMVLGRAIARDRFGAEGAGPAIAQMTAVMVLAPMAAPIVGGLIAAWAGWRAVFVGIGVYAAVILIAVSCLLGESAPRRAARFAWADVAEGFGAVARSPGFWPYCFVAAMSLSAFLTFVGAAPYVAAEAYGAGPDVYGLGFLAVGAGYMASNLLYARLAGRVRGDVLMLAGLTGATLAAGMSAAAMLAGWRGVETVFAPAVLLSLCSGLVVPNAMAGAVSACPGRAGAASSLLGFVQFAAAAAFTQAAAGLPHDSAVAMSLAMAAISGAGIAGFAALRGIVRA